MLNEITKIYFLKEVFSANAIEVNEFASSSSLLEIKQLINIKGLSPDMIRASLEDTAIGDVNHMYRIEGKSVSAEHFHNQISAYDNCLYSLYAEDISSQEQLIIL